MKAVPNLHLIEDIFEIQIRQQEWNQVVQISRKHQFSYTATVRLCVFRLLKKEPFSRYKALVIMQQIRRKYNGSCDETPRQPLHRHMLCLYGDDALMLRLAAAKVGMTITMFVRVALELYLEVLEEELTQGVIDIVTDGIKFIENVNEIDFKWLDKEFHNHKVEFSRFRPGSYWPWRPFVVFGKG